MAKGRLVVDVWKDHAADPFFWILLDGVNNPYKVYYGREGWEVETHRKETRAKFSVDREIIDSASRVILSIDISGPMDEIVCLIEYAGYHGSCARPRPRYLHAPVKTIDDISGHLATLPLLQMLLKNNSHQKIPLKGGTDHRPLQRPTRYNNHLQNNRDRWNGVVTGRHEVIDVELYQPKAELASGDPKWLLGPGNPSAS